MTLRRGRRRQVRDDIAARLEDFARAHRRQALVAFAREVTGMWPRGSKNLARKRLLALIEKHENPRSWHGKEVS